MPVTPEQLFTGTPLNLESKVDETPLSPLQNYVIQHMPGDLRAVRENEMSYDDLARKQDMAVQYAQDSITYNNDPAQALVTQMDLAFMLGSYLPGEAESFRKVPPSLLSAMEQQHDRFQVPKRMDYELIIDVNSSEYARTGLTRVYTAGEAAPDERDFYIGHSAAEVFARDAAYQLHSLAKAPETRDPSAVLASVSTNLEAFKRYMGTYGRMSKESFTAFRPYLASYPDGIRNASGAFMPSVQLLEVALHGPTQGYNAYVDEALPYFPRDDRPIITEWRNLSEVGINIEDQLNAGELSLSVEDRQVLSGIVGKFIDFRMAHFGVTYKQIPAAFEGAPMPKRKELKNFGERPIFDPAEASKGTGGFDITNVLGNSVYRLMQLQERLKEA